MKVALLGGTFNPPHLAHLLCASEAADQLGLDRVVLMPVFSPPHKDVPEDPGPEVRLELCELAVAGDERFEVSRLELDRGGASFTVVSSRSPIGPRACSFCVELPISAPMPNSPPSVKRVDAFTYTHAASTPRWNARALVVDWVTIASE